MNTIKHVLQQQAAPDASTQIGVSFGRPEDNVPSVWVENFGKFERSGSTFSMRHFKGVKRYAVGHSKPLNQPEPLDKQKLLKDMVSRMMRSGRYLTAGRSIEVYRNFSDFDRDSVHLFTLFDNRWQAEPAIIARPELSWLIQFLHHLYTPSVNTYGTELIPGKPQAEPTVVPEGIALIPDPKQQTKVDPFDVARRFKNFDELQNYTEKLTRDGHPHGQIVAYYQTVSIKLQERLNGRKRAK